MFSLLLFNIILFFVKIPEIAQLKPVFLYVLQENASTEDALRFALIFFIYLFYFYS